MLTTTEIFVMLLSFVFLVIAIRWVYVVRKYDTYVDSLDYTRGANAVLGSVINMKCEPGRVISVDSITEVYTNPDPKTNIEDSSIDPMGDNGLFNSSNVNDMTLKFKSLADGKDSYKINYSSPLNTLPKSGVQSQLIGTYTCILPGNPKTPGDNPTRKLLNGGCSIGDDCTSDNTNDLCVGNKELLVCQNVTSNTKQKVWKELPSKVTFKNSTVKTMTDCQGWECSEAGDVCVDMAGGEVYECLVNDNTITGSAKVNCSNYADCWVFNSYIPKY